MISNKINKIKKIITEDVQLIAVSKTKPVEMIQEAMVSGHLDFGENKVQEMVFKHEALSKEIRWHMIGHLQRNKVKYIAPFVHLIHGADSKKLLETINKEGEKNNRIINCLLQFHIAKESTKFGFSIEELREIINLKTYQDWDNINIKGVMGMATFTDNKVQVKEEFSLLRSFFNELKPVFGDDFKTLSMGMSGDYLEAINEGSNMIRIGSDIFGTR
jgi:pyridoxal phosphate enzyme (YggS family)